MKDGKLRPRGQKSWIFRDRVDRERYKTENQSNKKITK